MSLHNVYRDADWTSIPRRSPLRDEAPLVKVESFILNSNQIQQAIANFIEVATQAFNVNQGNEFYQSLYGNATTPEDTFWFPYFSDGIRQFSNNFSDSFQSGIGGEGGVGSDINEKLKSIMGEVVAGAGAFGGETRTFNVPIINKPVTLPLGKPGMYVETPMFYQYEKNDGPVDVTFVLSNTINSDSLDYNFKLIRRLTEINRPFRKNSIEVDPPRIYRVTIPGHRFIKWAYCSNFEVIMLGARRVINGVVVPEGYQISMSFQSLTLEHAGFMNEVGGIGPKDFVHPTTRTNAEISTDKQAVGENTSLNNLPSNQGQA